ncbi:MerR family transcriptional regulator [Microbacterium sp. LWS13-1.2]|uniref:MerR family transcriptional regulator n=1 Tax=Microbacterium sp. LWS13-1.2 TaxID=3135264 RepID=A0AAU6SEU9_9MICO
MSSGVTIGQAAAFVGVTVKTVQHYHKLGLIAEPERDLSGYRRYSADDLLRLVHVRTLAGAGVPLAEIAQLLAADGEEFAAKLGAASSMRGAENAEAVGAMTVDMIAGTPMEAAYLAKSPHPDLQHLQVLLDKLGATYEGGFPDRTDAEIRAIAAPTLITVGDVVSLEHAVEFLRLRGGDVNGDFVGVPASQLAVFPGTTHFFGLARTDLVRDVVVGFLDDASA